MSPLKLGTHGGAKTFASIALEFQIQATNAHNTFTMGVTISHLKQTFTIKEGALLLSNAAFPPQDTLQQSLVALPRHTDWGPKVDLHCQDHR